MSTKPLIGINGDYRAARKDAAPLSWFNAGYYDSVTAAGGLPMMVPPVADDEDLKQYLSMLDGLVIAGCTLDMDPVRMGMDKHPATRAMPSRREDFDRRLCTMAAEMKIPTLAVGVGMQEMNVVLGGTLIQNINEAMPRALHHRDPVENHCRHVIEIVEGSRLWDVYGPGEIRVNSQHHMAVDELAPPFTVTATCPDGVIEAYESVEPDWYCVGVQWHPENETSSALDMQVFQSLLEFVCEDSPAILPLRAAA